MGTVAFQKFNAFVEAIGRQAHNLNVDTLKILLTNVPPVAKNAVRADLREIAAGNGYAAGGNVVEETAYKQSGGTARLVGNAVTFQASGGEMAPFRYAVLYNATAANGDLIGWWDYGESITLHDGETFTVAKDVAGSNWDAAGPILSNE